MPNPFEKLSTGSSVTKFSITAWNQMLDMLRWWRKETHYTGADLIRHTKQTGIIWVKNSSTVDVDEVPTPQDCDRFDVLGIDGPLFGPDEAPDEFKNRVVLDCVTPVDPDHLHKFVILAEPIVAGGIGRAYIDGVCPARVSIGNAAHKYADIDDGETDQLASAAGGAAQILWTDDTWAVVRLGGGGDGVRMIHGLTTGDSDSSPLEIDNVVAIYGKNPTDSMSDTITVVNPHGFLYEEDARADVVYCEEEEQWEILQVDCP